MLTRKRGIAGRWPLLICAILSLRIIPEILWDSGSPESEVINLAQSSTSVMLLTDLCQSGRQAASCREEMYAVEDTINSRLHQDYHGNESYRIPLMIHQTSKGRCVTKEILDLVHTWKSLGYAYYFHDDDTVGRLIQKHSNTFPQLAQVADCITTGAGLADVWRYLVLWEYGGIYADIETKPTDKFQPLHTIKADDDAFFIVEKDRMLSQYWMAVSPKHPLMYIVLQVSIANLLLLDDTGANNPVKVTGPAALREAFSLFLRGNRINSRATIDMTEKDLLAGNYTGTLNRRVRVVGSAENPNELVIREAIDSKVKKELYTTMRMAHFTSQTRNMTYKSCLRTIIEKKTVW